MQNIIILDKIKRLVSRMSDVVIFKNKRAFIERRKEDFGLPSGIREDRRRGFDRRLNPDSSWDIPKYIVETNIKDN